MIFSIEGNIGSGKSTIVEALRQRLSDKYTMYNYVFLQEPVDDWKSIKDDYGVGILEKFYTDQEKYGFSFQMMAYISRLSLLKKALSKDYDIIVGCQTMLSVIGKICNKMTIDLVIENCEAIPKKFIDKQIFIN